MGRVEYPARGRGRSRQKRDPTTGAAAATAEVAGRPVRGGTRAPEERSRTAAQDRTREWIAFRDSFLEGSAEIQIARIREGTQAGHLVGVAETLGVSQGIVFDLVGLAASTAKRKVANAEMLDSGATERLIRIGAIEKLAEATFGDAELASAWLRAENTGLGGATPLSMLDTEIGCREVARLLDAIMYGGAA